MRTLTLFFIAGPLVRAFLARSPLPSSTQQPPLCKALSASPSGLSLEDIYGKVKLEVWDIDDGIFGIDSRDPKFGIEVVKADVTRQPSLGLELEELASGGDGRGLVLISNVGGNAAGTGIEIGDTICFVGQEPSKMVRVEALDYDGTVAGLQETAGMRQVTLVLKRLVARKPLNVKFTLPDGKSRTVEMLAGSNLRGEMIRLGIEVYDPKTKRYDQPYATGNCGGEGLCGTCFVEVVSGADKLSAVREDEKRALRKMPVRWRLSCTTFVGANNEAGDIELVAVPQSSFVEEARRRL